MRGWVYDPHSGGVKIPATVRQRTGRRIRAHAEARYAGKFTLLDIRFRGRLCYSNKKYEPCVFHNGSFHGTPEEAFETGEIYL